MRWRVLGRVQGVGFRYYVLQTARGLGVRGDVRNLDDGSVEVRAEAAPGVLEQFRRAVRRGPAGARVEGLEHDAIGEEPRFEGFVIRH